MVVTYCVLIREWTEITRKQRTIKTLLVVTIGRERKKDRKQKELKQVYTANAGYFP
jgi:hypothetical protein